MLLADVAIPVPLAHAFTYEVPARFAGGVQPGSRVACGFGGRKVVGVVVGVGEREPPAGITMRPIAALVDPEPVLTGELLRFLMELASYYAAPIGEVLCLALPAMERRDVRALSAQRELVGLDAPAKQVGARRVLVARATDLVEEQGKLRGQTAAVLARLRAEGEAPIARLEAAFSNARAAVKRLEALGLVATEERALERDPFFGSAAPRDAPPTLNDAQQMAASRIEAALEAPPPNAFLLFGVTGSGKTEVYLRALARALALGKGALVMVPEIALTPQLVARFRARFGDGLAVLHSGLSDADRHAMWKRLRAGEVKVAIGARSALFAPVPDLGLVVVDEEHDASFKQEEGVRYHARDMALLRAHRAGAVVVLGSATPSLEAIGLVRKGKLTEIALPDRAAATATLPTVTVVDLRRVGAGPTGDARLSLPLHRAIDATLAAGEQAILFLNRRGFAPSVVCEGCGTVESCRACSVALTFHRGGSLRCHYCEYEGPMPDGCAACGCPSLILEGLGTERLEDTLKQGFPKARVARLDRDVGGGKRSEPILARMRSGEIDILVGTQMVTKGHDLPNVTLVGVINADAALSMPDFRAAERGFQLLVQVAGRAGRADRPGRVIVQTRSPEHHAIHFATTHDVRGFLEHELRDRAEVKYPPYFHLVLVRVDAIEEGRAKAAAQALADAARKTPEVRSRRVEVLGPAPAPIARLRGRSRFRVMVRAAERGPLRAVLAALDAARSEADRVVRVQLDVDPVGML